MTVENNVIITLLHYSCSLLTHFLPPMQCILPPSAERSVSGVNQILCCFCLKHTNSFPLCLTSLCLVCVLQRSQVSWFCRLMSSISFGNFSRHCLFKYFTFAIFLSLLLLQLQLGMLRHFMLFHRAWMRAKGLSLVWFQICLCSTARPPAF